MDLALRVGHSFLMDCSFGLESYLETFIHILRKRPDETK
jgi:hypothetical protein